MSERYEHLSVPGPTITSVTKPFWDAIEQQQFIIQQCEDCKGSIFYPRTICPHCWSDQLSWKQASGKATLKTWGIVHRPGHPAWQEVAPYTLGVVQLKEGPTMMTHLLINNKEELKIGLPLEVTFIKCNENWLPFFKPVKKYNLKEEIK